MKITVSLTFPQFPGEFRPPVSLDQEVKANAVPPSISRTIYNNGHVEDYTHNWFSQRPSDQGALGAIMIGRVNDENHQDFLLRCTHFCHTATFKVRRGDTVNDFMRIVSPHFGIPMGSFSILNKGQTLDPNKSLAYYGLIPS